MNDGKPRARWSTQRIITLVVLLLILALVIYSQGDWSRLRAVRRRKAGGSAAQDRRVLGIAVGLPVAGPILSLSSMRSTHFTFL